jgi:hypothetical protein
MDFQIRYLEVGLVVNNANVLSQEINSDPESVLRRDLPSGQKVSTVPLGAAIKSLMP